MGTIARLDGTRTELSEMEFHFSRRAADVSTAQGGKQRVVKWDSNGAYTLQPINFTSDFYETNLWEGLKFRLPDCVYAPDWWEEVPENTLPGVGPCDYFFSGIVSATNYTDPPTGLTMDALTDTGTLSPPPPVKFASSNTVSALFSKRIFPANTGYLLRFFIPGRQSSARGSVLIFYFAEYAIVLHTNGTAYLYQSPDGGQNYAGPVYTFTWAGRGEIHGHFHAIAVVPHGRNRVDFVCETGYSDFANDSPHQVFYRKSAGTREEGCYVVPGELTPNVARDGYLVTAPGSWGLRVSREFRPYAQVSEIGYYNGSDGVAGLYDAGIDMGYAPTVGIGFGADVDRNGGTYTTSISDALNGGSNFTPNGVNQTPQFFITMRGRGDLLSAGGACSSISPEFYGYALKKPAVTTTIAGDQSDFKVQQVSIDQGDHPEAERLTVTIPNRDGAADDFCERSDLPIAIVDPNTNITLFEGTTERIRATESPATHPRFLEVEAVGMIENLLRMEWVTPHVPDFGNDPDLPGTPWKWNEALKRCYAAAGFLTTDTAQAKSQVVIEEEALYAFRLWAEGQTGEGKNQEGVQKGRRWQPQAGMPVHEFLHFLMVDVMGWTHVWDRRDHAWHVYKRPDPGNKNDVKVGKFQPKVQFFTDPAQWRAAKGLANNPTRQGVGANPYNYKIADFSTETQKPKATTVTVFAELTERRVLTKAQFQQELKNIQANPDSYDPDLYERHLVPIVVDNKKGYPNARNSPVDRTHIDFLRKRRWKEVVCHEIPNRDAGQWIATRIYEDLCLGWLFGQFTAPWGDPYTAHLRKYDIVNIQYRDFPPQPWYIYRIEPEWKSTKVRRARYRVVRYRPDARPPR